MALQLLPETESRVREAADRDGISIDELLNRFFAPVPPFPSPAPAEPAAKETSEETHARVMGLMHKWQAETGMPTPPGGHKSLAQLSAEWAAEDANLTEKEWEAERQFWEDFNRELGKWPVQI